jgi:tight adherence protein C
VTGLLAGATVVLAFAAAWELAGALEGRVGGLVRRALSRASGGRAASIAEAAARLRLPERIARAGLAGRLDPAAIVSVKLAGAALGVAVALIVAPALGPRIGLVVAALLVAGGFLAPDALLERTARRRHERLVAALPDALDMVAVGAASGQGPTIVFAEVAAGTSGPLAAELGLTLAEIECGAPVAKAIERLRGRVRGAEVGALAAALERSQTYGSPLAEQLHLQATSLRGDARRRIEDRAARAAPKIQLVVALVLVPSVLLIILAAVIAHADSLLSQF